MGMIFDPHIHHRQSIRLKNYNYSNPGAYFVTICVKSSEHLLSKKENNNTILTPIGKIVHNAWVGLNQRYPFITLDEFVIMPDHIHGIIFIHDQNDFHCRGGACSAQSVKSHNAQLSRQHPAQLSKTYPAKSIKSINTQLPQIICAFKSISTIAINRLLNQSKIQIWQRNYYEHIIRNENELNNIREYIINNPKKLFL